MLAVDHGYFQGPTTGLVKPRDVVAPLVPSADSLLLTRGVLRASVDANRQVILYPVSTPEPLDIGATAGRWRTLRTLNPVSRAWLRKDS